MLLKLSISGNSASSLRLDDNKLKPAAGSETAVIDACAAANTSIANVGINIRQIV
jgi:hypothetical protein